MEKVDASPAVEQTPPAAIRQVLAVVYLQQTTAALRKIAELFAVTLNLLAQTLREEAAALRQEAAAMTPGRPELRGERQGPEPSVN